jgi:hypothetical protein
MVMSDSDSLLLLKVASLLPGLGQSLAASFLVAYWAVTLYKSSEMYLKISYDAWKGGGCRASCALLPCAFGPGHLGSR